MQKLNYNIVTTSKAVRWPHVKSAWHIDVEKHPQIAQLVGRRLMKAISALLQEEMFTKSEMLVGKTSSPPFVRSNTSPCLSHPLR